jgi:deoxyribodipyrimidine photolyase-related protein
MGIGIWVLGNQLNVSNSALASVDRSVPIVMIESLSQSRERSYHQQKLVLVWSAMRHFAQELREQGYSVEYCEAEDFQSPLRAWIKEKQITELRLMAPVDKPFAHVLAALHLPCPITMMPNNQFLWSEEEFCDWATGRKRLVMEDFYRECRKRHQILMTENGKPIGDRWNYDQENRKPPKKNDPAFNPPEADRAVHHHDKASRAIGLVIIRGSHS